MTQTTTDSFAVGLINQTVSDCVECCHQSRLIAGDTTCKELNLYYEQSFQSSHMMIAVLTSDVSCVVEYVHI